MPAQATTIDVTPWDAAMAVIGMPRANEATGRCDAARSRGWLAANTR